MTMAEPELASLFDLTGRVAIVTGASSGLGERFARVLHAAGASVVAVARRTDRLEALAASHERMLAVTADLTADSDVQAIVPQVMDRFGRLDVLVNNAGMGVPVPAEDEDLAAFRYTLEVNLVGLFNLARLAARPMLEAGSGSIINIASVFGLVSSWPLPNASYTSSKGAVVHLTRELACQWAARGVRVNALAPGFFPAESTAGMQTGKGRSYVERGCPMRRFGRPEELDGPLLFLASAASSYVTGQTLGVDGGWTAH
ncbi:MAG: short-chain dehydrogenase/reductase [Mycobacterium sp.]|nr:short-chain dehydrogenase/reductase [Mycobacterium sp.]